MTRRHEHTHVAQETLFNRCAGVVILQLLKLLGNVDQSVRILENEFLLLGLDFQFS